MKRQSKNTVRGYINFRQFVSKHFRNKEQDVGVLLCDLTEPTNKDEFLKYCEEAFEQYLRIKEAEELLEKLKGEENE